MTIEQCGERGQQINLGSDRRDLLQHIALQPSQRIDFVERGAVGRYGVFFQGIDGHLGSVCHAYLAAFPAAEATFVVVYAQLYENGAAFGIGDG